MLAKAGAEGVSSIVCTTTESLLGPATPSTLIE
jgi:hypothetical protein